MRTLGVIVGVLVAASGEAGQHALSGSPAAAATEAAPVSVTQKALRMWMTVGERRFASTLTDNAAARALAAQLPLTLDMSELNGNEKHAELPKGLPANAGRPGTIHDGDVMLYGSTTLVLFYKTSNSSYSYTRLGRVNDPNGLSQALGREAFESCFPRNSQ